MLEEFKRESKGRACWCQGTGFVYNMYCNSLYGRIRESKAAASIDDTVWLAPRGHPLSQPCSLCLSVCIASYDEDRTLAVRHISCFPRSHSVVGWWCLYVQPKTLFYAIVTVALIHVSIQHMWFGLSLCCKFVVHLMNDDSFVCFFLWVLSTELVNSVKSLCHFYQ